MRWTALCIALLLGTPFRSMAGTAPPTPATVSAKQGLYVPPTQAEKTRHYFWSLVNPMSFLTSGAGAAILQWENTPSEWKQGGEGYGKRIASSYGGHVVRQTLMFGASSLLHEDNRYYLSGRTGFGPRLKYALESEFLTRREDGSRRFAYSRMGADLGSAFISRAWQPDSNRHPQNALSSFGVTLAVQTGLNVAREFLPIVRRHMR